MENTIDVLSKIASAINRRDEIPNQELAQEIISAEDHKAVQILVDSLRSKNKAIQNDCIKVIYEIGDKRPDLILIYFHDFLELLGTNNNRLQWGVMTAINCLASYKSNELYHRLPKLIHIGEKGSVITRDYTINIMIEVAKNTNLKSDVFTLLLEQLLKSPDNQFPKYAEQVLELVDEHHKKEFRNTIQLRLQNLQKQSHINRIQKVLKKLP